MEGKATVALTFAVYRGDEFVRREAVAEDIVKIGKDPRSHVRLDDEAASRMHAVIEVASPTEITLIDLGNEPATRLNGSPVSKSRIRPGDSFSVGDTRIELESAQFAHGPTVQPGAQPGAGHSSDGLPEPPAPVAPRASASAAAVASLASSGGTNPFASAASAASGGEIGSVSNPFAAASPFGDMASNPFASSSPFVASQPASAAAINSPGGSDFDPTQPYTFALVKSGPDVRSEDVETHASAVEVLIKWGDNTLHVSHESPPKSFYVGEDAGCDYFIPTEALGGSRAPLVVARGVAVILVMLPRSHGTVEIPGQGTVSFSELISKGRAKSSTEASGAHEFELPSGAHAHMALEGSSLAFEVSAVNAGRSAPVGVFSNFEPASYLFIGLSFLLHIGTVASMAFFMPHMNGDDDGSIDRDQLLLMQRMLNASAEREQEEQKDEQASNATDKEGGSGTRAKGEEGSMGNPNTRDTNKRYGVQGPKDNPDPHLARQAAMREAQEFGMIGLINVGAGGDPNAPTAPWGRDDSSGNDPMSARGNMWGDAIGDAFGAGGLGLSGVGEGGGGRGGGIGLGNIGTLGHGSGTGTGQGFGNGHGRLGGAHQAKAPTLRQGSTTVNGRLPPEVIQRIVRQNFGRFRLCYDNGLRTNPNLQGRVSVKFVIDRSGAVSTAQDGGSDLADQGVVSCVVRGFNNRSFPQPEGGIVTVVYPIIFTPGD